MSRFISSSEFFDKVNSLFYPSTQRKKTKLILDKSYGDFCINHFSTGLGISYTSFIGSLNEDTIIEGVTKDNYSFLSFNTSSNLDMQDLNDNRNLQIDSGFCWSGTEYEGHKVQAYYERNKLYKIHHIVFESNLFKELLQSKENVNSSEKFFKASNVEVDFNYKVNQYQKLILNEMLSLDIIDNKLKELYLESKLLDLVYNSINSMEVKTSKTDLLLSNKDIESLNKAKEILIKNTTNPLSIKQLAYKSAINEFKLKKGFKQLFGNTVFGYLQEHRLNEAKILLESEDININEAATLVGYKSVSHFSKIFKEHFGTTPLQTKKKNNKTYY